MEERAKICSIGTQQQADMPCLPALLLLLLQVSRRCMAKVMEERAEICSIGTQQQADMPCLPALLLLLLQVSRRCMAKVMEERAEICSNAHNSSLTCRVFLLCCCCYCCRVCRCRAAAWPR
jgi:hypothetical protein